MADPIVCWHLQRLEPHVIPSPRDKRNYHIYNWVHQRWIGCTPDMATTPFWRRATRADTFCAVLTYVARHPQWAGVNPMPLEFNFVWTDLYPPPGMFSRTENSTSLPTSLMHPKHPHHFRCACCVRLPCAQRHGRHSRPKCCVGVTGGGGGGQGADDAAFLCVDFRHAQTRSTSTSRPSRRSSTLRRCRARLPRTRAWPTTTASRLPPKTSRPRPTPLPDSTRR